jgi:hypothetical protein
MRAHILARCGIGVGSRRGPCAEGLGESLLSRRLCQLRRPDCEAACMGPSCGKAISSPKPGLRGRRCIYFPSWWAHGDEEDGGWWMHRAVRVGLTGGYRSAPHPRLHPGSKAWPKAYRNGRTRALPSTPQPRRPCCLSLPHRPNGGHGITGWLWTQLTRPSLGATRPPPAVGWRAQVKGRASGSGGWHGRPHSPMLALACKAGRKARREARL